MPPKRKAQEAAPGEPGAQRQRTATDAPEPAQNQNLRLPIELMMQIVLDGLRCTPRNNDCAFSLLCSNWLVCHEDRQYPQLDEILRKLRVDEYVPSEEAQELDEWPGFQEPEPVNEGEEPEPMAIPYMGEVKTYWAGHSVRKVQCPLYNPGQAAAGGGRHGYDNTECNQCGCPPFRCSLFEEDLAPWDYEYPGKVDPFQDEVAAGPREIEGMGRWAGRLRKDKGYKMTEQKKKRERKGWPQEGVGRLREICPNTTGWNGYLNSIRHTKRGKVLIGAVKKWRATQRDTLVRLEQRPVKWFGGLDVRGLAVRIVSGQEGALTWGDETLDLLPFIPRWTDRYEANGGFRETWGTPPPNAAQSAVHMAPYAGVKKHFALEVPHQDTSSYEYKFIRHLMINAYTAFQHAREEQELIERFGHPHPRRGGPRPGSVWERTQRAITNRVRMECHVPLYVDYQAMTALESLYLDLTNVVWAELVGDEEALYLREVLGLAQRLEGKNLQRLVIAGLRINSFLWPGERDLPVDVVPPVANPRRWSEVNWMYEFRKAVRAGGKVFLVDAHNSWFGDLDDPDFRERYDPWLSQVERRPQQFNPPAINLGTSVIDMEGHPLFLNNDIDRQWDNSPTPVEDQLQVPPDWQVLPEEMPDGME